MDAMRVALLALIAESTEARFALVTSALSCELLPEHIVVGLPETVKRGAILTVTAKVLTVLFPHILFAVTLILPLIDPTVVVIEFVVEVPVQPDGKVQV
jgi:hypothetical protein